MLRFLMLEGKTIFSYFPFLFVADIQNTATLFLTKLVRSLPADKQAEDQQFIPRSKMIQWKKNEIQKD